MGKREPLSPGLRDRLPPEWQPLMAELLFDLEGGGGG